MSLPEIGTWTEGPALPAPAKNPWFSSAAVGDDVYFIGNGNESDDTMQIYNIISDTWRLGPSMPTKKWHHNSIAYNKKIYCFGGNEATGYSDKLEIYDTETSTWTAGANMLSETQCAAVIEFQGKIYCIGKVYAHEYHIQIYDPGTNTWSYSSSVIPEGVFAYCTGVLVDDDIYVAGHGSYQMWIYNISTDIWRAGDGSRKYNKYLLSSVRRGDFLYYFGMNGYEIYDWKNETWSLGKPLIPTTYCIGSFVGDSFYSAWDEKNPLQIYTFGQKPAVIHRFICENQDGANANNDLQPYPAYAAEPGDDYTTSIPYLTGYEYVGYSIDAGDLITDGSLPVIEDVQVDHTIFFVYREGGTPVTTHTVTEQFHTMDGAVLKEEVEKLIPDGEDYVSTAPAISGWRYTGWQLDDGPVQSGIASIPAVTADHTITFLYEEDGGEEDGYTITESYLNLVDGSFLQADTFTQVPAGGGYSKTAPEISGYKRVGQRIDGEANSGSLTASIPLVSGDHQVFFLYVKEEEGGGNEGDDCKCCCTRLEIKLTTCGDNQMVQDFCDIVKKYKDKDCCC